MEKTLQQKRRISRENNSFVCINCGQTNNELYREILKDVIKLSHCESCSKVVDKYVEFDPVIILLDALLFREEAYCHIIYNARVKFQWKLCVVYLLCDAYMKWAHLQNDETNGSKRFLQFALRWDFYAMFLIAALELMVFLICVMLSVSFLFWRRNEQMEKKDYICLHKALLLSCYGKLLVIPAVIWGQVDSLGCLWLTRLFMLLSCTQSVQIILNSSVLLAITIVLIAFGFETLVATTSPLLLPYLIGVG
ncbi:protein ARV1-like [Antedon mediterranea]|uniref:protein ARV1-like n=1 Tax=Antedon mediterranea TaxID=105859 RepID=UPI003AF5DDE5